MIFHLLLILWIALTALLWRASDRLARRLPRWSARLARGYFALFYLAILGYSLLPLARPLLGTEPLFPPDIWATAAYLWFPFVLQMTVGLIAVGWLWRKVRRRRPAASGPGDSAADAGPAAPVDATVDPRLCRREALTLAALMLPPIATLGLTIIARRQAGEFRVRRQVLAIPSLPQDLDGVTIAHVTDIHFGNFFDPAAVRRLVETVNTLGTDLVAMTGDLLDRGLLSRLPIAMEILNELDRRHGFAMVEGNHDLHESAESFEAAMREAGIPLLLDEERTFTIPGRPTPVQMLGVTWGELKLKEGAVLDPDDDDPPRPERRWTPAWAASTVKAVAALRRADAFPILLAHHPHTILPAAEQNLPLVLSGHTHGGQIMLTDDIGVGPLRFKYWRGTHVVGNSRLVICNGVGSWFPLRVNAPAEVLHLTLRRV